MSQFQHRACCHWHCCHTSETELSLMWLVALVSQNVCCERGLSNTKSNNVEKRKLHCMDEDLSAWSTSGRCPHCKDLRIQLYVYAQRHTYAYTHFFIRWMENHSNILNLTNTFQWQDQQRWKVQLIVIHQEVLQQFSNNRHWVLRLWLFTTLRPNITWRMIDHKVLPSSWLNEIVINWEEAASVKFKKKNAK